MTSAIPAVIDLGVIPIVVKDAETAKLAGQMVEQMCREALNRNAGVADPELPIASPQT